MAFLEKSVICPVLIGRAPQQAAIARVCAEVRGGAGRVLLIAGEAGLGKSRLAAETAARLSAEGWAVLRGQCSEHERAQPYAPLIDLLRAYGAGRASAELVRLLGAEVQALVGLLPELAHELPVAQRIAPEQQVLFPVIARLCVQLAAPGGLLFIIEDLHWSDPTSLDLLLYLARHLVSLPVLLLATYRIDEVSAELRQLLAQFDRQRLAVELRLAPLNSQEVDQMLRTIFEQPQSIRPDFLEPIYTLTEGNPFFIEETLKAMLTAGEIYYTEGRWDRKALAELHIPRSVDEALRRRSGQLSAPARELLTLAAVVGRRFDFRLLERLTGVSEAGLIEQLKELIAAQFVVEESADRFAFRHALTRRAIASTLLARERRSLHRSIATTLMTFEDSRTGLPLADLAYHCFEGELWAEALEYARKAAEQALSLYAPASALVQLERAFAACERLGAAPEPGLFLLKGRVLTAQSSFAAARADLETALNLAEAGGRGRDAWQALIALGDLWATRNYRRAGEYFVRALEHARILDDPLIIAENLNFLGNWHMNQEHPAEAVRLHREALTLMQQLGDRLGIAQTIDLLAISSHNRGDLIGGRTYFEQAIALWRAYHDRRGLIHSQGGLSLAIDYRLELSDMTVEQALGFAAESVREARAIGWRSGEALALICRGLVLSQGAFYAEALAVLRTALAIAEEIEHLGWTVDGLHALGALHLELLAFDEARTILERSLELAHKLGSMIWVRHATAVLAVACVRQQEFERARLVIDEALGPENGDTTLGERMLWGARAELALVRGDPATALSIVRRLVDGTVNLAERPDAVIAQLWYLRGRIYSALRRFDEAAADLEAAAIRADAEGRRGLLWRIRAELARVYRTQGRILDSTRERDAARHLIETLAAEFSTAAQQAADADRLAGQFVERAIALLPDDAPAAAPGGLTAREREVAALVAQGKTNREIADMLVLSERTAERHVANIMARLNFNTRAQIAAWAVQAGLTQG